MVVGNFKRNGAVLGLKVSGKVLADNASEVAGGNVTWVEEHGYGGVVRKPVFDSKAYSAFLHSLFQDESGLRQFSSVDKVIQPVLDVEDSFCRSYGYEVVGHGKQLNADCDRFIRHMICPHVELHKEHAGLVFTHKVHHHCNSWRCPKCFFYGSAVREAQHIEQKLAKATKEFGMLPEAGTVSVPKNLYGASEEVMRKWAIRALKRRGIVGGNLIFHPLRYASTKWINGVCHMAKFYYAPHFHFLAYFQHEYGRCRNCKYYNSWGSKSVRGKKNYGNHGGSACLDCDGFEGLTRRMYKEDGFVVKVFDKRSSFFKTAVYELSHAGFKVGAKRVQISTWFGNCKGVKVAYQPSKLVCPECKSDLIYGLYSGNYEIVKSRASPDYLGDSWLPMDEGNGVNAWVEGHVNDFG